MRYVLILAVSAVILCGAYDAQAATFADYEQYMLGTSYVDGYCADVVDFNVWPTDTATYTTVESWFGPDSAGHWYAKTGSTKAIDGTAFQGKDGHEPPQSTMTVAGLDDSKAYDVYGVCWCKNPEKTSSPWYTRLALSGDPLIDCSYATATNIFFDDGGTGVQGCEMYLGTVSGVTELSVVVEAPPVQDGDYRAWFDGVSYAEAIPEPSTAVLLIMAVTMLVFRRTGC